MLGGNARRHDRPRRDLREVAVEHDGVVAVATIVRMLLVPATMELLGDKNWWLPRWLDRLLPNIDVEGHDHTESGDDDRHDDSITSPPEASLRPALSVDSP